MAACFPCRVKEAQFIRVVSWGHRLISKMTNVFFQYLSVQEFNVNQQDFKGVSVGRTAQKKKKKLHIQDKIPCVWLWLKRPSNRPVYRPVHINAGAKHRGWECRGEWLLEGYSCVLGTMNRSSLLNDVLCYYTIIIYAAHLSYSEPV